MTAKPCGMKNATRGEHPEEQRRGPVGRRERDPPHAHDRRDVEEDDVPGLERALEGHARGLLRLLQSLDQIQVRRCRAAVAVGVRPSVRRHRDRAYVDQPGEIGRCEGLPGLAAAGRDIHAHELSGNAPGERGVQELPVRSPLEKSRSLVCGMVRGSPPATGRREASSLQSPYATTTARRARPGGGRIRARGRDGPRFPRRQVLNVQAALCPGSAACRSSRLPPGNSTAASTVSNSGSSIVTGVPVPLGVRTRLDSEPGLRARTHLPSAERSSAAPAPSLTAGEPSVLRR